VTAGSYEDYEHRPVSSFSIPCSSILTPIDHVNSPSLTSDIMANESSNQRGGSGNFANDPAGASEAGRKGGEHSKGGQ
jgi:hypothetical protein